MTVALTGSYHECPGNCGRDDIHESAFCCPDCFDRLPRRVQEGLTLTSLSPSDTLAWCARAQLYLENRSDGR